FGIHFVSTSLDCFYFYLYGSPRDLHSFPTRRSSDLGVLGLPVLLATALAPGAGAVLAEVTGSYATGFAVLAAVAAVGTVLTVASTHGRATTAGRMRPLDMQVGEFRRQS